MQQRKHRAYVRTQRVAEQNQETTKDQRSKEGPEVEVREVHLRDPGRNRDDAPQNRQKTANEDCESSPALEETMHDQQSVVREMNVLSIPFDERHAAEAADRITDGAAG